MVDVCPDTGTWDSALASRSEATATLPLLRMGELSRDSHFRLELKVPQALVFIADTPESECAARSVFCRGEFQFGGLLIY